MFQSTPPHGGRHDFSQNYPETEDVSIHAPARGATKFYKEMLIILRVSIHAPARGATDIFICFYIV